MKICSTCGIAKSLGDFYRRKSGLRAGKQYEKCSDCFRKRGRAYYQKTRLRQIQLVKLRKAKYIEERKAFLAKLKDKPCIDCGKIYSPWVMDFDHRDGRTKIGSISYLSFGKLLKFDKIREEIAKCDLVCANCHRERTYKRLHESNLPR